MNFMAIWYQIQGLQDFDDRPRYHNTISTAMSQKLRSVLSRCICDAIIIQILNKIGGFFFVFLHFLQVKEMEWWHFFLLGTWWRRRWEAQTIFLHSWTKSGTPNNTQVRNPNPQYNWRLFLCVPPYLTSETIVWWDFFLLGKWRRRLSSTINTITQSNKIEGHNQYYNTIEQDWAHQNIPKWERLSKENWGVKPILHTQTRLGTPNK
jgi:hypothetical protein